MAVPQQVLDKIAKAEREGATELNLSSSGLTPLDEIIPLLSKLPNLTSLDLSGKSLSSLPDSFGNMTSLTSLYLGRNSLSSLTEIIPPLSQLPNLTSLDLSHNSLSSLPDSFGDLTSLTTLYLFGNSLTSLPDSFGSLTSLTSLNLVGNSLTSLPDSFGSLTSLTSLSLFGNSLTSLPDSFGSLTSLTSLSLVGNSLTSLPDSFGDLTSLTTLYLVGNSLSSLPDSFGSLTSLTSLDLSVNSLTVLPESIVNLTKLTYLDLSKNSLTLPPEIAGVIESRKGVRRLFAYLRQLRDSRPLNEAKVILVGEAKTGKTSLVKRLMTGEFDPNELKTDGIDIHLWNLPGVSFPGNRGTDSANEPRTVRVNLWDLGGQEIYHATHQFFLTERTLYLLVLSARSTDEQNRLHYWLKTIRALGKDAPILIVHNQYEVNPEQLDRKQLREKYPSIVPGGFLETSCSENRGIEALRAAIQRELGRMRHVADPLPASYFAVKERLEEETQEKDFLNGAQYDELCQSVGIAEDTLRCDILRLLHALGTVVCFQDDLRLRDTNVLNPEWVTEGVYSVLDDATLKQAGDGILTTAVLPRILRGAKKTYPKDKHQFILDMMEKFELCFQSQPGEYLVPELLRKSEPDEVGDFTDALRLELWYDFLPQSVLPRFIVRTSYLTQPYRWRKGVVLEESWRKGVALEDKGNRALVRADNEASKVTIAVTGNVSTRRDFLSVIRDHFAQIHRTPETLVVKECIPLAAHPEAPPVLYSFLRQLENAGIKEFPSPEVSGMLRVSELLTGIERHRPLTARTPSDTRVLRERMVAGLTLDEVNTLWRDLLGSTMNEAIPRSSLASAVHELLSRVEKRRKLPTLRAELERTYPHVLEESPDAP